MATTCYKLTDDNLQTYNGFQWAVGEWREAPGEGDLCTKGWLHGYDSPELALFMSAIHIDFKPIRSWRGERDGRTRDDGGLKRGTQWLRIIEEIPVVMPTSVQIAAFGILCAKEVCREPSWVSWAEAWLNGAERSADAAWMAARVTDAVARMAADAAADAAARAAARAAAAARPIDPQFIARKALTY